jgi:hypothetical protein
VDAVTLARYANAVMAACQALLEDDATPPSLLPALLATLQQAARHQHTLKCVHRYFVDVGLRHAHLRLYYMVRAGLLVAQGLTVCRQSGSHRQLG